MVRSYRFITSSPDGRKRVYRYTSQDLLAPGSVVLLHDRYWLVVAVDDGAARARPARYRLTLRHPDGRQEAGFFRRFRSDAPTLGHQLTTLDGGLPIAWAVVERQLAHDDAGQPFVEFIAERDYTEVESLPDHELEHTLDRERDDISLARSALARATASGLAVELVGLESGEAPEWEEAALFLDALILDEIGDQLIEQCGIDTGHVPRSHWLDRVKRRLSDDLDRLRGDIEGGHHEIEEWDFQGGRVFAAIGNFTDDSNPLTGYGWMCRLVDASVLEAAGFYRVRKPLLLR
jgi:hypothetical protein